MILKSEQIRLSATDLSNHLACRHLTVLDLEVARGTKPAPGFSSPDLRVIQELGLRHEAAYLASLTKRGFSIADLRGFRNDETAAAETRARMKAGVDVIAQGTLAVGRWFGRPDLLRKVPKPSVFGDWSYEVYDCKLARETKATTILQLALYSDLLATVQGQASELMYVVPPAIDFAEEAHRIADYAAYFRHVKARLEKSCDQGEAGPTYPEPCAHCDVCRWYKECDATRRADDHLSLVAGISRLQRNQFVAWDAASVASLAVFPIPLKQKPLHGSRESHERVREQARVQVDGRVRSKAVHELLAIAENTGFCRLPAPSAADMFVDLEGDPFVGSCGQEYLFGFVARTEGQGLTYEKRWALTPEQEKLGFEWLVDEMIRRWKIDPSMHVYHFGSYESATFKRLMGAYATREDEIDRMLRAKIFVDHHTIFKQAVRASVEEYSLKALESLTQFVRHMPLTESRAAMRYVEHGLELGRTEDVPDEFKLSLEGYNSEDCYSTVALREWLEGERQKLVDAGQVIPRPDLGDGAPSEELDERQKKVAALVAQLTADIPFSPANRSNEQSARWMLAQLLDWHRRENKASWWEGYRLADLDDEDLMDERAGLAGLRFTKRIGLERTIPVDRYAFEKQETEVRAGKELYRENQKFGEVVAVDVLKRTIDIKKTRKAAETHPPALYVWDRPMNVSNHADSLLELGEWVRDNGTDKGINAPGRFRAARDLLLRKPPRLSRKETIAAKPGEEPKNTASRIACALDESVFAIQGPPGAGKTYTGARMICELVKQGKKIGITALSHKVIRKLLDEVVDAAEEAKLQGVKCLQKVTVEEADDNASEVTVTTDNDAPLDSLRSGAANVLGGTSWLWTRPEYSDAVDVLFIDEAGQMALADVVAVSRSAKNVVLIGDPQQLDRPLKGSHPPGAESSALQHLLGEHQTIPDSMGLLLPETWRLHPGICTFTSELFYEGRLSPRAFNRNREIFGHPWLNGAGLWFVPVDHQANRNSSAEEIEVIARIVESLLQPKVKWSYGIGNDRQLTPKDILIVAPFNAQVADLTARMPDVQIGTVDKFQGQEAPVVIYSLTTSSPEDAPRGMEFLYSLNRLNVATSRAMSNVILVGSPRLFEPECRNPRQMKLANALCRYLELANVVDVADVTKVAEPQPQLNLPL
jgi:predicted RecB family nuclease